MQSSHLNVPHQKAIAKAIVFDLPNIYLRIDDFWTHLTVFLH